MKNLRLPVKPEELAGMHLFNTELAMHYRAIFKYGCFQLFCDARETLLPCFGPYFL